MHRNIRLLLGASILIHAGANLMAPLYAVFVKEIGGTLAHAGTAVGTYALLRGILYLQFAHLHENRFSPRTMMVTGYVTMGITYLLYTMVNAPVQIFFLQALLSVGEALVTPSWSAVIAQSLTTGRERETYGKFYGYRSLAEGIAAIVGGLYAFQFGFTGIFVVMAFLGFGSALLSAGIAKPQ